MATVFIVRKKEVRSSEGVFQPGDILPASARTWPTLRQLVSLGRVEEVPDNHPDLKPKRTRKTPNPKRKRPPRRRPTAKRGEVKRGGQAAKQVV